MSDGRKARWNGSPIRGIVDRRIQELGLRGFKEFAEQAKIPYTTLYNIARGRKAENGGYMFYRPSMDTVPLLAHALELREDEVTYLFSVVSDDRESRRPDSPLYEPIQTAMLQQHRMQEESLHEYGLQNGICPEVLEAVYFGGKDSEGRLAQPPIGTLQDIAIATHQDWFRFMNLYAHHPNSNHVFFTREDIAELQMIYVISEDRRRAVGTWPKVFEYKIHVAGYHAEDKESGVPQRLKGRIWLDESFIRGRDLAVFQVLGDSMEGGKRPIFDGDLIIVDRGDKGRDAMPVVARLNDGSYTCKLLKQSKQGESLISTNPTPTDGAPFHIPIEEIDEIEGRVIEVRRSEEDII